MAARPLERSVGQRAQRVNVIRTRYLYTYRDLLAANRTCQHVYSTKRSFDSSDILTRALTADANGIR